MKAQHCAGCAALVEGGCAKKLLAVRQMDAAGLLTAQPGCHSAAPKFYRGPGRIVELALEFGGGGVGGWFTLDTFLLHLFKLRGKWAARRHAKAMLDQGVGAGLLEHRRVLIGPFCGRLRNEYRPKAVD